MKCPQCGRDIGLYCGRFAGHSTTGIRNNTCRMSDQYPPTNGTTDDDYEHRAKIIADLAYQIQDCDPGIVWDYLTSISALELQRLLMLSLAAINTDQSVGEMFGWVTQLPAARRIA